MLVSARADAALRREVREGLRPRPEYLALEADHHVELLDWSMLPGGRQGRSGWGSALHVAVALRTLRSYDAILSDGEHVGIPLALSMLTLGISRPHLVIGHRLSTSSKVPLLRDLRAHRAMSRILVHSPRQLEVAMNDLRIPAHKVAFVPYHADADFWRPLGLPEEALIVAAGREHRDYATLAAATAGLPAGVFVAAGSLHSPRAVNREPATWPSNWTHRFARYMELRDLYARASVVVVPVVATDFQAGVTTVLEAMAMGKAVITSDSGAQGGVVRHDETGILVRHGDATELREAIADLLAHPRTRQRLGEAARHEVLRTYHVDTYAARLAGQLAEVALPAGAAA